MSESYKRLLVVILMSCVIGLVACKQEGPAEKAVKRDQTVEQSAKPIDQSTQQAGKQTGDVASDKSKPGEFMDDTAITAKVKAEIANDPLLKTSQISVTTTNGVVRLSGVVDSRQTVDRALEITRNVKDVKSTDNGLVVKGAN